MAVALLPVKRRRQPPYLVGVARSNPLTRGLVCAFNAAARFDAVSGRSVGIGAGNPRTDVFPAGVGIGGTGATNNFWSLAHPTPPANVITWMGVITPRTLPSAVQVVVQFGGAGNFVQIRPSSANAWRLAIDGSGALTTGPDGPSMVVGKTAVVVGTYDGATLSLYVDGVAYGTAATAQTFSTGAGLTISTAADMNTVSVHAFLAWNNRLLALAEIAELAARPWQLFESEELPIYFTSAPPAGLAANPARGGGAAINPIWGMAA